MGELNNIFYYLLDNPTLCQSHHQNSYFSLLLQFYQQNYLLAHENLELKNRKQAIIQEKERIQTQNQALRNLLSQKKRGTKRKYSQRRTWLQKIYKCWHKGCNHSYSSRIALNSHIRRIHENQTKKQ